MCNIGLTSSCTVFCQMSYPIETAITSGAFKQEEIPQRMQDYFDRLKARKAYQDAKTKHDQVKAEAEVVANSNVSTATGPGQHQAKL